MPLMQGHRRQTAAASSALGSATQAPGTAVTLNVLARYTNSPLQGSSRIRMWVQTSAPGTCTDAFGGGNVAGEHVNRRLAGQTTSNIGTGYGRNEDCIHGRGDLIIESDARKCLKPVRLVDSELVESDDASRSDR
jgi:hypothetical protein